MWLKKYIGKLFNNHKDVSPTCYIRAYRPKGHPKGAKFLMRIPVGGEIPQGVILGKGTIIDIETQQRNGILNQSKGGLENVKFIQTGRW